MTREDYVGQEFGTRRIVRNNCIDDDWLKLGMRIPKDKNKYRLGKCLLCGFEAPVLVAGLIKNAPKRCCCCSGINNNSIINGRNSWDVKDDIAILNVVYRKSVVSAVIDSHLFDTISSHVWRVCKKKNKMYMITGSGKKQSYMHMMVLSGVEIPSGYEIDHIDGNSLNNRRNNLRVVSRADNIHNTRVRIDNRIGIRGVSKCGKSVYCVDFVFNRIRFYFKHFKTVEEAVLCRRTAEEYFGMDTLKKNPLADKYTISDQRVADDVIKHTIERIQYYLSSGKPPV